MKEKKNKKIYIILIILLFVIGISVRVLNFPYGINGINCDEAMVAINAKAIADTGKDIYQTSFPVYFESWGYGGQSAFAIYIIALLIKLFGFNLISIRLPSLIFSIVSLIVAFSISKCISDNKIFHCITLFLFIIMPWNIMQSQWVLDCNFFPQIFIIAILFLLMSIKKRKLVFFILSSIFFSLTLYTYGVAIYVVPIFLIIEFIYLLLNKRVTIKWIIIFLSLFAVIAMPILLMFVINFFKLNELNILGLSIQRFRYVTRQSDMLIFSDHIGIQFLNNCVSFLRTILLQYDSYPWNAFKDFGTIYLISIPLMICGIVYVFRNKKNVALQTILIWFVSGLFAGLFINDININRINIIWYPILFLASIGFLEIIDSSRNAKIAILSIILLYIVMFINFIVYFYNDGNYIISNSFTFDKGLVSVIKYTKGISDEVVLSKKVVNSDKNDIFIRYATEARQLDNIKIEDFIKYYDDKEKVDINFSTDTQKFTTIEIEDNIILDEEVYLIEDDEVFKVQNVSDYNEYKFGDYIILYKNNENN